MHGCDEDEVSLPCEPTFPPCSLCGREFTGRGEHGASTHFSCRNALLRAAKALASNLAIVGALCQSFKLGEYFERAHLVGGWRLDVTWRPNTDGKAAP